jgi:hypothetical protein
MLYYHGRYEEAIEHLDMSAQRYEKIFEQPATEEYIWKAACIGRLKGELPSNVRKTSFVCRWLTFQARIKSPPNKHLACDVCSRSGGHEAVLG